MSVSNGDSSSSAELGLNADDFVLDLYRKRTFNDSFWAGIKVATVALALLMSSYALYKTTTFGAASDLGLDQFHKAELQQDKIDQQLQKRMDELSSSLDSLKSGGSNGVLRGGVPLAFDCHLTSRHTRAAVVTYDGCFVDTTGGAMNRDTGVFTVKVPGIYQLTFTAKYVSSSAGRFGAWSDIYVNDTVVADSQREYNGNELSTSESSTHSVLVIYPLGFGDLVKVQFNKDGNSYIHSDNDHDVHFTALRLGELP